MAKTKICSRSTCKLAGEPQPLDNFHTRRGTPDGRAYHCRECDRARQKAEYHAKPVPVDASKDAALTRLFDATKKAPVPFSELCDRLDLSPARLRALISSAQERGMDIKVTHDRIGYRLEEEAPGVQDTRIPAVVGRTQRVGVISDLHYGSRYCLREPLREFVRHAYRLGVREILVPGDLLDGNYVGHGLFELSHVGLENQVRDLAENLPELDGLTYHAITGNHDLTFQEQNGVNVARSIGAERPDVRFYGNRGAFLKVRGAVVHLWHPKGGASYAASYQLQKRIERYAPGEKPQILLAGHWHRYCAILERGIHAMACPTFQGGGSAFGKAIGGAPAIGGMILSWDLTEHGTIRDFTHSFRAYYERERPVEITTFNGVSLEAD